MNNIELSLRLVYLSRTSLLDNSTIQILLTTLAYPIDSRHSFVVNNDNCYNFIWYYAMKCYRRIESVDIFFLCNKFYFDRWNCRRVWCFHFAVDFLLALCFGKSEANAKTFITFSMVLHTKTARNVH